MLKSRKYWIHTPCEYHQVSSINKINNLTSRTSKFNGNLWIKRRKLFLRFSSNKFQIKLQLTPLKIHSIIYAALFKDYQFHCERNHWNCNKNQSITKVTSSYRLLSPVCRSLGCGRYFPLRGLPKNGRWGEGWRSPIRTLSSANPRTRPCALPPDEMRLVKELKRWLRRKCKKKSVSKWFKNLMLMLTHLCVTHYI